MKKALLLIGSFCILSSAVFAQTTKPAATKKKEHYRIINNGSDDPLWVEKAMYHANMDSLRFVNERRRIPIEGTSLVLELYSAQELLTEHQKPIHPLNITDATKARKYKLRLDNGLFTAIPVK